MAFEDTAIAATTGVNRKIAQALRSLFSEVPSSSEPPSSNPAERARTLTLRASAHAALVSGTLALPPGPLGLITVLPDLLVIWRIQRQLVADIAAAHGKAGMLGPSELIYCLFRHAAGHAVRDLVVRVGERVLVRQPTLRVLQRALSRVGVSITQRAAGRTVSRWLPVVGAIGIGGYAFYDTTQVGKTAASLYAKLGSSGA